MGLLSYFFKKKEEPTNQLKFGTIPTVEADPKMFSVYEQVFYEVMADVDGFTSREFDEILQFIMQGKGGYMNMAHYYKPVFSQFFAGRHWAWVEYDYWERTYAAIGEKPLRFQTGLAIPVDRTIILTVERVLRDLKVSELRELIESQRIDVPKKSKKTDLLALAQSIPNLHETKVWKEKEEHARTGIGYPLYSLLMRYIAFKANTTFERNRAKKVGVTEFQHMFIEEGDEQFAALALKRNPQALPPYFPGDVTMLRLVIPGFDE